MELVFVLCQSHRQRNQQFVIPRQVVRISCFLGELLYELVVLLLNRLKLQVKGQVFKVDSGFLVSDFVDNFFESADSNVLLGYSELEQVSNRNLLDEYVSIYYDRSLFHARIDGVIKY